MRRFTIAPDRVHGNRVEFDREESRHLARVVRLRPGAVIVATDGAGHDYTVRLDEVGERSVGHVLFVSSGPAESPLAVTLVQGVPKGDKMEVIVRAATELGVARVAPALCERTVVRLEPAGWRERVRRWNRVAREAAKQAGRAVIPVVEEPRSLDAWLEAAHAPLSLCCWEGEPTPLAQILSAVAAPHTVSLIIGPEGGLSRAEAEKAAAAGWRTAGLGPRILRTETAGPAVLAILQSRFGDLGVPRPA
jgi:16S rRNA (uracil1498-N3)-methyltransferase